MEELYKLFKQVQKELRSELNQCDVAIEHEDVAKLLIHRTKASVLATVEAWTVQALDKASRHGNKKTKRTSATKK